jgi:hypothetical protein
MENAYGSNLQNHIPYFVLVNCFPLRYPSHRHNLGITINSKQINKTKLVKTGSHLFNDYFIK